MQFANVALYVQFENVALYAQFANVALYAQFANVALYVQFENVALYVQFANVALYAQFANVALYGNVVRNKPDLKHDRIFYGFFIDSEDRSTLPRALRRPKRRERVCTSSVIHSLAAG